MRYSLFSPTKLATGLIMSALIFNAAFAAAPDVSPPTLPIDVPQVVSTAQSDSLPVQIAHCGLEGCPVVATQLLSTSQTNMSHDNPAISDSLWGTLLLTMAFQRDTKLQALNKKLARVDTLTLTSVAAISALGLAQSVTTLHTLDDEPHKKYPVVLGMVGTTASLLSLGGRVYFGHRYRKQMATRQWALKQQVENILLQYESGQITPNTHQQLVALVGDRASHEFEGLWIDKH